MVRKGSSVRVGCWAWTKRPQTRAPEVDDGELAADCRACVEASWKPVRAVGHQRLPCRPWGAGVPQVVAHERRGLSRCSRSGMGDEATGSRSRGRPVGGSRPRAPHLNIKNPLHIKRCPRAILTAGGVAGKVSLQDKGE